MTGLQVSSENTLVDAHFHILPGVDDGAKDLPMALEMARLALADGVKTVIATPHPDPATGLGSQKYTSELVQNFNLRLHEHGLGALQVVPGVECYLTPEVLADLRSGKLITLNGSRYVLIEFHTQIAPVNIEYTMYELRNAGYVPIIAHPERYNYVQQDFDWLARLVRLGCLSQVTAGAFYGRFGTRCQNAAEGILGRHLAHLLASDAHNLRVRAPGLSPARARLEELGGPGTFHHLAVEIPGLIVQNQPYEPPQPPLATARPFWKFWQ